jgi:hypothetical protein
MLVWHMQLHPLLSGIVNKLFYEAKLVNGVTHPDRAPLCPDLPTLLLCDSRVHGQEKTDASGSFYNMFEANVVVNIVRMLLHRGVSASQIGVISLCTEPSLYRLLHFQRSNRDFYAVDKAQEAKIAGMLVPPPEALIKSPKPTKRAKKKPKKRKKSNSLIDDEAEEADDDEEEGDDTQVDVFDDEGPLDDSEGSDVQKEHPEARIGSVQSSTVDAFQGAEKDVIVVSCSRTTKRGFIDSPNRLNVALTRAKHHLIIVGSVEVLQGSPLWARVIETAQSSFSRN